MPKRLPVHNLDPTGGSTNDVIKISSGKFVVGAAPSAYTDPLTTKGDLVGRSSSATVRKGVGSNGQVLTADSTQTDGLLWKTLAVADISGAAPTASPALTGSPTAPTQTAGDNSTKIATTAYVDTASGLLIPKSLLTTKGDLITRTGSTVVRQGVGADDTVLMADSAQTNGIKYQALDDSYIAPVAPNDQTGTTYTFVLADKHRLVTANNASAVTVTVPPNSSVAYPLGTTLSIYQKGAGQVTVAAGAGVTLRTPHGAKTFGQYSIVSMIQVVADIWAVTGDTTT